jgi:hypothetical protein
LCGDAIPLQENVIDVDLSDHRLLPCKTSRPWSRLDKDSFRAALWSSLLGCPESASALDVDELNQLYDSEITNIVDRMIPLRTVQFEHRPLDPWFDDECRATKRSVRLLERAVCRADPADVALATSAWTLRRADITPLDTTLADITPLLKKADLDSDDAKS